MNRLPLVVSFYTLETPYEEEVTRLIASCKQFDVEHLIEGVPSAGSWEMNCAFKPLFLLKKLEELKRPLLWVDADAVFMQPLSFLDVFSLDLGVRLYHCPDDHPSRVVTATLFANATDGAVELLKLWAYECLAMLQDKERTKEVWDQDALRRVLLKAPYKSSWGVLPEAYSIIAGHPDDNRCLSPIIVQNQASRRFKKWVNGAL